MANTGIMKEGTTILYSTETLGDRVTKYAESTSLKIPQSLLAYHTKIYQRPDSFLVISNFEAQALIFLSRLMGEMQLSS